jgi:lipopolysaccharide transport system ATP-binding protein
MNHAISIEQLCKRYRISHAAAKGTYQYQSLRESVVDLACLPFRRFRGSRAGKAEDFWALKDVTFKVAPGEVIGIIGRNGAGKSTLLKLLSRITKPTSGEVKLRGRVGSLLEVGTGFHPELTGRENIFLNGAILGMSRREVSRKFDEIVAFAEIDKFLDTPVKRYSSGMYVRLAFAVASQLEPEILIIDEVLAVGDASFQKKCLGKMNEVARQGRTVLFVSHNMTAVQALCSRVVVLVAGKTAFDGTPSEAIEQYMRSTHFNETGEQDLSDHPGRLLGSRRAMTTVRLRDKKGKINPAIGVGESITVEVDFDCSSEPSCPVLGVVVKDAYGAPLFGNNNRVVPGFQFERMTRGSVSYHVPQLPLQPGQYSVDLYLGNSYQDFDSVLDAIKFEVHQADVFGSGKLPPRSAGPLIVPASWSVSTSRPLVENEALR